MTEWRIMPHRRVRPRETCAALADTHPRKCLSPARALWGCKDKPCKHRTPEVPAPSERSAGREMLNPADLQLPQARVCDERSGGLAKLSVTNIHLPPMSCIRPKRDCSGTDPPPLCTALESVGRQNGLRGHRPTPLIARVPGLGLCTGNSCADLDQPSFLASV